MTIVSSSIAKAIDILNNEFTGEQITSEEAIESIINELKSQYPCNGK